MIDRLKGWAANVYLVGIVLASAIVIIFEFLFSKETWK